MLLKKLLEQFDSQALFLMLSHQKVIYFQSKEYPLLFLSLLIQAMKRHGMSVQHVDMQHVALVHLKMQLEMYFLGNTNIYWLGDIAEQSVSIKKELAHYCSKYRGPHSLMLFLSENNDTQPHDQSIIVELSSEIDHSLFLHIAPLIMSNNVLLNDDFVTHLYKKYTILPLETVCMLIHYAAAWDSSDQLFFDEWADMIITSPQSLFTLSQHFFAGKVTLFFEQWKYIKSLYSSQFWCSFWSDQLWRAYHYIYLATQGNMQAARAVGFRLPFSFLRKDWQLISCALVQKTHQRITEIDFALKNGADEGVLDLFYSQFLHALSKKRGNIM